MRKLIKILILIIVVLAFAKANSQATDLFRTEFTYFPQSDSDNSFRRFRTFVNVPLKVKEQSYLVPFIEYRNVHLLIRDDERFRQLKTDRYESIEVALGYTFPMENNWRFGARVGLLAASNFDEAKPISEDLFFTGSAYFIKDMKKRTDGGKPWRLVLGVQYSTTVGRPFPLPYVNYYREFATDWSYSIGAPKMNLRYRFNDQHSVQLYARLDGFYANIQNDVNTINGVADNISMTTAMMGPGYTYNLTKHISFYVYAGYTIFNDIRLRDADGEDVRTINSSNTFYSRAGIKFQI
ncbi:hypothetical protein JCM19294_1507 [Nonlabens tegetincola]|uniref:DUF6268 domain-containing protein n=2 Tax=Nonlabens tegetincola TaxID=323273 RepID=A0A090QPQ9_9FLAO|nr:hypothetical protein JCM19294_1507 [Nonlabens tegetincola]